MKVGSDIETDRPAWLAHIVADPAWGEPTRAVDIPQPVKVPSSAHGHTCLETRFTRQWVWLVSGPDGKARERFGVMLWDLGWRISAKHYVIEATGPHGRAVFDRPVPLSTASIEACLHFAGFPVEAPYRFA